MTAGALSGSRPGVAIAFRGFVEPYMPWTQADSSGCICVALVGLASFHNL